MIQAGAWAQEDSEVVSPTSEVAQTAIPVDPTASDDDAKQDRPKRRNALIEEIVVTAQKREENLQDVPISVQAFSGEKLDALGVKNVVDLPRITPGLVLTETIGYVSTYIRGLGSDAFAFADPSVAIYIDGIYNPSATTATQDFGPVERIEVLKGPQGTLFGRNAIGGAVNIISKPLSFDRPSSTVSVNYLDYDSLRTSASISIPLTDSFAIGVSALYNSNDPYSHVTVNGNPISRTVQRGARGRLRWQAAEWAEFRLNASTVRTQSEESNIVVNTNPSPLAQALQVQPQDLYGGDVNEDVKNAGYAEYLYSGQLNLHPGPFDIRLLASQQDVTSYQGLDFDGSPMPIAFLAVSPRISDIKTAELQLVSNDDTWLSDRLSWIVGGYFFKGLDGYQDSVLRVAGTQLAPSLSVLGASLPIGLSDALGLAGSLPLSTGAFGFSGLLDTKSISGFVQSTYKVADWMSLTLGARYQVEKRGIHESTSYARNTDGTRTLFPGQNYSCKTDRQWCDTTKAFSPKATIDFHVGDDTLLYLTWQKATKASTFNTINIYDAPEFVPSEKVSAYEAGVKTRMFDGLVTANASAFYYDLRNLQVQFVSLLSGGALTFESAPKSAVKGIEFDVLAQVLPDLMDDLVVTASAALLDAKYKDFTNANGFDPMTGVYSQNLDNSGNQIVRSPKFSGSASINKTFRIPLGAIELGADYYRNSGFYFLAENQAIDRQPAYGLLGARATLAIDEWGLRISAFGQNLTGERYYRTRLHIDFGALDAPAPRAVFGGQIAWELPY